MVVVVVMMVVARESVCACACACWRVGKAQGKDNKDIKPVWYACIHKRYVPFHKRLVAIGLIALVIGVVIQPLCDCVTLVVDLQHRKEF